jgi:hypothetical protein
MLICQYWQAGEEGGGGRRLVAVQGPARPAEADSRDDTLGNWDQDEPAVYCNRGCHARRTAGLSCQESLSAISTQCPTINLLRSSKCWSDASRSTAMQSMWTSTWL